MNIKKRCADHLRATHKAATGHPLGAGHSHEIVAAFFGYASAAALALESAYPLDDLPSADIVIPDILMVERRIAEISGLPDDLPSADALVDELTSYLVTQGLITGECWKTRDLADYLDSTFLQGNPSLIEEDLAGQIAGTNAYFDELYVDHIDLQHGPDDLVATVIGSLNGENDQDSTFHGDSIAFTTVLTFGLVAGRRAYAKPLVETTGAVDASRYYDDG